MAAVLSAAAQLVAGQAPGGKQCRHNLAKLADYGEFRRALGLDSDIGSERDQDDCARIGTHTGLPLPRRGAFSGCSRRFRFPGDGPALRGFRLYAFQSTKIGAGQLA